MNNKTLNISINQKQRILLILIFLVFFVIRAVGAAEITEPETDKINFLKQEILSSNCQFERNGKVYSANKALEHISNKQSYYKKKINSAQDFINYTATKSHISGNPYYLICNDQQKQSLAIWLNSKLLNLKK
ncbi:MAG: DUF5329 family protein [Xanthomonadales bacterium]|nr:DUF5329 family protein [Xanthomonadales bacterium]